MPDEICHALLTDLDTRREANLLFTGLDHVVEATVRDEHAVLIATAALFMQNCEMMDVCPFAALGQILELMETDQLSLEDDPAQGRFVFPEARA